MVRFGYLVPAIGTAVFGIALFGGLLGAVCAVAAGYAAAAWIRNAEKKAAPYIVLFGGGALMAALGAVVFMARFGAFEG